MNLKGWLLLTSILIVFIGLAFVAGITIRVPYTGMVTYTEKEPYSELEPYEETEPVEKCSSVQYNYDGGWINPLGDFQNEINGHGLLRDEVPPQDLGIVNYENEMGSFGITIEVRKFTDQREFLNSVYYDSKKVGPKGRYIGTVFDPTLLRMIPEGYRPEDGYDTGNLIFRIVINPPKKQVCETHYEGVTKSRTVTKFREVAKQKPVTKYETLWEALIGKNH